MVNVITKSGGNAFSGSFRDTLNNDNWRTLTPFEPSATAAGADDRASTSVVPTYEYTFGGPILRDRLWFFTAGRLQKQESGRNTLITTQSRTPSPRTAARYEFKGTYSAQLQPPLPGDLHQARPRPQVEQHLQPEPVDGPGAASATRELPEDLFTFNYTGVLTAEPLRRGAVLASAS